ncbi:hypothetical protein NDU88_001019 [Pleurodeles waltl]|uniref:Uncharacterized protein n=1 Tax=Pleurodeles waltl TaxID=8319 RepID=A0AAV7URM5_PLEWA|nr:hypothetical protein NDU88_001019 [Pleurodeles waltl]
MRLQRGPATQRGRTIINGTLEEQWRARTLETSTALGVWRPRIRAGNKREEEQQTEREEGRCRTRGKKTGKHNREDAGPEKKEEDVPKEANDEEEGVMASKLGWKADRGGVWILQPCHTPGGEWLEQGTVSLK